MRRSLFSLSRALRAQLAALVVALLSLAVIAPTTVAAQPANTSKPDPSSLTATIAKNGVTGTPVYDTAWEMPVAATFAEIEVYFDHLYREGFAGTWVSYFDLMQANLYQTTAEGDLVATINDHGQFELTAGYMNRFQKILDMAHQRGLTVSIAPVWAAVYLNGRVEGCSAAGSGPLFDWNAFNLGWQLGNRFGQHPAVGQWIMGGDNFCGVENANIWNQLAAGLADQGAHQPTTYHSPAIPARHYDNLTADWLDFAAPQTGHCQRADLTKTQLQAVRSATNKPVIAGELRYEGIQPTWDCSGVHGPGRPVSAEDVRLDVQAALDSGVNAILFGHNERWQWGVGVHGSTGRGGQGAIESLGSPGEKVALQAAGATRRTSPPQPSPTPPSPQPKADDGDERAQLQNKVVRAEQRVRNAVESVAKAERRLATANKARRNAAGDIADAEKAITRAKKAAKKASGAKAKKSAQAALTNGRDQLREARALLAKAKTRVSDAKSAVTRAEATLAKARAGLRAARQAAS